MHIRCGKSEWLLELYNSEKNLKKRSVFGSYGFGKNKKASLKSGKKIDVPKEEWIVTKDTHEPLVSAEVFERVHKKENPYNL